MARCAVEYLPLCYFLVLVTAVLYTVCPRCWGMYTYKMWQLRRGGCRQFYMTHPTYRLPPGVCVPVD